MFKKLFLIFSFISLAKLNYSQVKIGDNPSSINNSALLELESTNKGVVFPRMNSSQMNSLSNMQGLVIYNTDSNCLFNNNGLVWISLCRSNKSISWLDTQNTTGLKSVVNASNNLASGAYSFALGQYSISSGLHSTAIGFRDTASGNYSFALGYRNLSNGIGAVTLGSANKVNNMYSVGIGQSNVVNGFQAFCYGQSNSNAGNYSYLLGQSSKITMFGAGSFLCGSNSYVNSIESTILGGSFDSCTGNYSVARGRNSKASGIGSLAFGDTVQSTGLASYTMGVKSKSSGKYAYSLGYYNLSSGNYSYTLGKNNVSSGYASYAIGDSCISNSAYSFALGKFVSNNGYSGAFVLGDNNSTNRLNASANNSFNSRFSGGYNLYSNATMSSGVQLAAGGGSWSSVSDRNKKENFKLLDYDSILMNVLKVPVLEWNYISQSNKIRHIGPMAQDFYNVFKVGESDTTITTIDIDGVNFAAIKALYYYINKCEKKIEEFEARIINLETKNETIK